MTRNEARALHISTAVVGISGLIYGWMRYFATPDPDSFSVVNHPWQPDLRDWHLLTAPLLVFACGLVWRSHVWLRFKAKFRARRRTGITLAALVAPMVVSGYALQVAVEEFWRDAWIVTHVATSVLWLATYCVHQLAPRSVPELEPQTAPQSED